MNAPYNPIAAGARWACPPFKTIRELVAAIAANVIRASARAVVLNLLKAAVAELDSIIAEAPDVSERLIGVAALVEEALADIERDGR